MKTINAEADVEQFFLSFEEGEDRVLFLDFDGTLAPFVGEREQAVPYPGVLERLRTLIDLEGVRLVIVSGRSLSRLLPLLKLDKLPEVWGCHGWERLLPNGDTVVYPLERRAKDGLAEAERWVREKGHTRKAERKPASLAIHWRGCDPEEEQALCLQVAEGFGPIAASGGLELNMFDGGVELRARGRDKGSAVETVLGEFADPVIAAYLGDDLTDEDAFRALGERGLSVLVRKELRTSEADLWIEPPGELLDFLDQWIQACQL